MQSNHIKKWPSSEDVKKLNSAMEANILRQLMVPINLNVTYHYLFIF